VFKAQHRVEECLKRAKREAGLADYQVRTWAGWHHQPNLIVVGDLVADAGKQAGKKARRLR
jgi:hypothetical protein